MNVALYKNKDVIVHQMAIIVVKNIAFYFLFILQLSRAEYWLSAYDIL